MNLEAKQVSEPKIRLHYLDGLRGLTSLYVVIFHIQQHLGVKLPVFWLLFTKLLYGPFAVVVFIVLSGYCLMLPVARSKAGCLSSSFPDYIKKRSRRILPPYYTEIA
jgi:peptidoglycan/LPS O-acetylase OafA/YrhL